MTWPNLKISLDNTIDDLQSNITAAQVPLTRAHFAAVYIFGRLKKIELELDRSTEEADDNAVYIHDALQGMQNDVKHLSPDELYALEDHQAVKYVTTLLEQIRAMQKVKQEIDKRITDATAALEDGSEIDADETGMS